MKKLVTCILCLGAVAGLSAQTTSVKQAEKLSGKTDKLGEARSLIKQAMENPETKNQAYTYYVAGKIELDAFDNGLKSKMINPDDPAGAIDVMGKELIDAYNYFLQALPLDSLPNEKNQVKPKYSKDILNKIKGHYNDFYGVGADYYNAEKYYPESYDAFIIYTDIPSRFNLNDPSLVNQQQMAFAFYNAGIAANKGGAFEESAKAFKNARLLDYDKPEATIYEIASWQEIAQKDNDRVAEAQANIMEAAQAGVDKFGIENTFLLNNLINAMVSENQSSQALDKLNNLIAQNPENANLYGLRAFVYDRMENSDLAEADYRKSASLPDADAETLKYASNKLYKTGIAKLNEIEGTSPEANAARQNIKENYLLEAQKYANQANQLKPGDSVIQSLLDSIDYALTTFFN